MDDASAKVGHKRKKSVGVRENKRHASSAGVRKDTEKDKLVEYVGSMAEAIQAFTQKSGSKETNADVRKLVREKVSNAMWEVTSSMNEMKDMVGALFKVSQK